MRVQIYWAIIALVMASVIGWLVYSQYHPAYVYVKPAQPAFVISFDDTYINEWHNHRKLFRKYDVRATFFITQPSQLTTEDVQMLHDLAADGHEIASHGYHHVNAPNYVKEQGISDYVAHEIIPSIKTLQAFGFAPVTFAYPYGARSRQLDRELSKYFYLLRGDSWKVKGKGIDQVDRIYYSFDGRRVINGLGIDSNSNVSLHDLEAGFKRASRNKEAIVMYAHRISADSTGYTIAPETLEAIFKAAKTHRLTSLTFRDLAL